MQELRDRCEVARAVLEELHMRHTAEGTTPRLQEDVKWLELEIQMVQAEALTRLAYKSW